MQTALTRCSPESVGVPCSAVNSFLDAIAAQGLELHSLMLLRHGQVFAEGWWHPYSADRPHLLYSLSKSFASTAIGMLGDEGRLSVDDRVASIFPDDMPADASENVRAMRVRDLLTMTAGHAADDMSELYGRADGNWPRGFLARPVPYAPGTHFLYNTSATYMCSAILTRITGESMFAYLAPRLFDPLGIEGASWETCPDGCSIGGTGLSVKTEDIAKFGQLYLRKGVWNGRRLISEAWIEQATSAQVSNGDDPNNDWNQGYGFQFWRCRHDAYRGDGAFGQFCIVVPSADMVIAMTSSVDDMGAVMQAVWDYLRFAPAPSPLLEDASGCAALRSRLAGLSLPGPIGEPTSPTAQRVAGCAFVNENAKGPHRSLTFDFEPDGGCEMTFERTNGKQMVRSGGIEWDIHKNPEGRDVAMRGAWSDPTTYTISMKCLDGPEGRSFTCRFEGDRVECRETKRGYFGPSEGRSFDGKMA